MRAAESSEDDRLPSGVYWISLIAGLLVAGLGAKSVFQDYRLIRNLTDWEEEYRPTPAKFIQVRVRQEASGASDEFYPDVLFEYFVDGKSVWGWRLSFEEKPQPKDFWENRLRSYRVGEAVTAYVNPGDAKDSFLEPKRDDDALSRSVLKALVGLGFVAAGLLLCWIPMARAVAFLVGPKK